MPGSPTVQYTLRFRRRRAPASPTRWATPTTYTYDQMGRVLTEQNPVQAAAGKDTAYTYDADGNLLTATDANGHTTTYTYNARDELVTVTDPMDDVTTLCLRSPTATSPPSPTRSATPRRYTYDADNELLTVTDPTGGTTTYTYDLDDEVTAVTDPNGNTIEYGYNTLGRVHTETLPRRTSGGSGGRVRASAGLSGDLHVHYDLDGNLLTVTDPQQPHDDLHLQRPQRGDLRHQRRRRHDELHIRRRRQRPDRHRRPGPHHDYTYDAMGDVLTETDPSGGGTTTYTYDAAGDLLTVTDPDHNTTTYTYNCRATR